MISCDFLRFLFCGARVGVARACQNQELCGKLEAPGLRYQETPVTLGIAPGLRYQETPVTLGNAHQLQTWQSEKRF